MELDFKDSFLKGRRRAVAPIIATLLMVAISVVGGIVVFVFAQGFFTEQQITAPTADNLEIFGYDARQSTTSLRAHNGTVDIAVGGNAASGAGAATLDDGDAYFIYVRNRSALPVAIDTISVFGTDFTFETSAPAALGTSNPGQNEFALLGEGATTAGTNVIGGGQEVTVVIRYDEVINGEIKAGRSIPTKIFTAGGYSFLKNVINGVKLGA